MTGGLFPYWIYWVIHTVPISWHPATTHAMTNFTYGDQKFLFLDGTFPDVDRTFPDVPEHFLNNITDTTT